MAFRFYNNELIDEKSKLKSNPHPDTRPVLFEIIQYNESYYDQHTLNSISELKLFFTRPSCADEDYCTWMNIEGIHRNDILDELSSCFNLHTLIKEDISTINERMKLDLLDNGSSIYLLMKKIFIHPDSNHIKHEQISFILREDNLLITFQEAKDPLISFDVFQVVKHRLKNNRGRIRSLKSDYLFYCLIDVLIENYMFVLDRISVSIDHIDKLLMNKLNQSKNSNMSSSDFNLKTLKLIYTIKHDMLSFRILCQPLREIVIKLQKAQDRTPIATKHIHSRRQYRRKKRPRHISLSANYFSNPNSEDSPHRLSLEADTEQKGPLFNDYIFMYFKDLNDHIIQLQDRIETYCDLLSGLTSFYMILNDAEMNRIMAYLALVSLTFIPLIFINGLFSMNYQNMPPLVWHYGYFLLIAVLGVVALFMITLFKWKKWL